VDVVAARDLAEGFLAGGDTLLCLLALVGGELRLAAELDAVGDSAELRLTVYRIARAAMNISQIASWQ